MYVKNQFPLKDMGSMMETSWTWITGVVMGTKGLM